MNSLRIVAFVVAFASGLDAGIVSGQEKRVDQAPASFGIGESQVVTLAGRARLMCWIQFPPLGGDPNQLQVVCRRNPSGEMLEPPVVVSTTPPVGGFSNLRIQAKGNQVYAAWERVANFEPLLYEIRFSRSTDGGASWEPDRLLSQPGVNTDGGFDLKSGPGSDIYVVFAAPGPFYRIFCRRSLDGGQTWQPGTRVDRSPAGATRPSMATDSTGRIAVAWRDGRLGSSIFGNASDNRGQSFGASDALISDQEGLGIQAAIDGAGTFLVGFEAALFNSFEAHVSRSADGGHTWEPPQRIDSTPNGIEPATMELQSGSNGRVYAVFVERGPNSERRLTFRKTDDGGVTYAPPTRLDDAPAGTQVFFAKVQGSAAGNVLAIWAQLADGLSPGIVLARSSSDFGTSWSDLATLSNNTVVQRAFPDVTLNPGGTSGAVTWQRGGSPTQKLFFTAVGITAP